MGKVMEEVTKAGVLLQPSSKAPAFEWREAR
jgi:hypothetical protein